MTYEDWWLEFTSAHPDWRYADSEALRKAAFESGAASRDAEVERYAYVVQQVRKALCGDIHNTEDLLFLITSLQAESNQLREQVKMLRIAMENAWEDGYCFCGAEGLSDAQKQFQRALAATEPKE